MLLYTYIYIYENDHPNLFASIPGPPLQAEVWSSQVQGPDLVLQAAMNPGAFLGYPKYENSGFHHQQMAIYWWFNGHLMG